MKILKNKTVLGIGCILLAMLVCFLITPLYSRQLDGKKRIVVVEKNIKRGQQITKDMVKIETVGSYKLPEQYVSKVDDVVGSYSLFDLYEGEYISESRLRTTPLANDEYLEGFDGSKGALSITIQSFAAGLSGKLFSGDVVSVIATDDKDTVIPDELKYVKVLACTLGSGEDVDENTRDANKEEEATESKVADTITLFVNTAQAKLLANLEVNKKLHIELVYRGDDNQAAKFLKQQDEIIKEMMEDKADE